MTIEVTRTASQVAENINTLMFRANTTQRALSPLAGMTESTFGLKMSGKGDWRLRDLDKIADALHVTVEELVGTLPDRDEWEKRRRLMARTGQ